MQLDGVQPLIFKKYKKTEISLDWTLLKLSFHDLQIFKQIFQYNIGLINQRSEKMALLAEEAEEDDEGSQAEEGLSSNLSDSEEEFENMPSRQKSKHVTIIDFTKPNPIGPAPQ